MGEKDENDSMSSLTNITVVASSRTVGGKSEARRTRSAGKVPAVVYGPGETGLPIAVEAGAVQSILTSPQGRNTVVKLTVDGREQLALLKSYDYHPLTRQIEHADFYTVKLDRPVLVQVPFVLTGRAKGVAMDGGTLRQIFRTLPVLATPDKIPAKIEADVTHLGLGEGVHVRELKLAEGVRVKLDNSQTLANVVAPEKDDTKAATPEAAPAKGAAKAAPAAKAAAAPAKKK